jgi:hypothetical protein
MVSGITRTTLDVRENKGNMPRNLVDVIWRSIQEEKATRAYLSPKFFESLGR